MSLTGSVTYRVHLVPMNDDENMSDALAARVRDPLWLLARQWQFGEFEGENAGSPVKVSLEAQFADLRRYGFTHEEKTLFRADMPSGGCPLDALVEGESLLPGKVSENYRVRAEAGQHFVRLLRVADPALEAKYAPRYLEAYPLAQNPDATIAGRADAASRRFGALLFGRVVDGIELHRDLARALRSGALPAHPLIDKPDQASVLNIATGWIDWFEETYGLNFKGLAWDEDRLEYNLAVSAPGDWAVAPSGGNEIRLEAREHRGGRLDWYSFDVDPSPTPQRQLGALGNPDKKHLVCFPTPLRFSGMATARYWEFEDGQVNLSRVSAAPEDLPRLLMLEFMLVYGNDFFSFPLEMQVGSLCQIQSLAVLDVFGQTTDIPPAFRGGAGPWSMYSLSYDLASQEKGAASLFFLAPAMGPILESQPIEQVRFLRDEMANLVWAVERRVLGQNGRPIDRFEIDQERKRERRSQKQVERHAREFIAYTLSSADRVPEYWFPLVPMPDDQSAYTLQKARLLHGLEPQEQAVAPRPWGELLGELSLMVPEEEIPREGVEIQRFYRLARALDGNPVLWQGRRRKPGKGEGSSGLRYDVVSSEEEMTT